MKRISLRSQIVGVFVLLYGTLFVILLWWMLDHILWDFHDQVDRELRFTALRIAEQLESPDTNIDSILTSLTQASALIAPSRHVAIMLGDSMLIQSKGFPSLSVYSLPSDLSQNWTYHEGIHWYRVHVLRSSGFVIASAENITATQESIREAFMIVGFSIPLVVLLSVVAGYYLVRRLLQPIDDIIGKAKLISSANLSERIPVPQSEDEIRRMVETVNGMVERLEQSFQRMEQFTANASHELRTPLTVLRGELDVTLQSERTVKEYREILASNLEEVTRISHTVDSLFLLARMDNKSLRIDHEPVDLRALLEEIYSATRALATEKNISVSLHVKDELRILGDTVLLTQLFMNLVDNAVKYTDPGGTITLQSERRDGTVRVSITDSGIGIPAYEIPRIFDRFYRVDKNRSRLLGGAGLGLSIAKWISEIHKGEILVQSTPGRGTTFTVLLPVESGSI